MQVNCSGPAPSLVRPDLPGPPSPHVVKIVAGLAHPFNATPQGPRAPNGALLFGALPCRRRCPRVHQATPVRGSPAVPPRVPAASCDAESTAVELLSLPATPRLTLRSSDRVPVSPCS
ncbi:hypothetical protein NDU88_003057 [Pleurodeles waltl]|uniref:Uncharacterized protein n=1 Tax=Pleurodeles waltl TaxID=8319 RepID=A0AAV7KXV2_PLEWA|nr:hypothetical protein NDU88_003057 [Pleurodeles waltl]